MHMGPAQYAVARSGVPLKPLNRQGGQPRFWFRMTLSALDSTESAWIEYPQATTAHDGFGPMVT
jgi:hypothetical protein